MLLQKVFFIGSLWLPSSLYICAKKRRTLKDGTLAATQADAVNRHSIDIICNIKLQNFIYDSEQWNKNIIEIGKGYQYNFPLLQSNDCICVFTDCGSPVVWSPDQILLVIHYHYSNMGSKRSNHFLPM